MPKMFFVLAIFGIIGLGTVVVIAKNQYLGDVQGIFMVRGEDFPLNPTSTPSSQPKKIHR